MSESSDKANFRLSAESTGRPAAPQPLPYPIPDEFRPPKTGAAYWIGWQSAEARMRIVELQLERKQSEIDKLNVELRVIHGEREGLAERIFGVESRSRQVTILSPVLQAGTGISSSLISYFALLSPPQLGYSALAALFASIFLTGGIIAAIPSRKTRPKSG